MTKDGTVWVAGRKKKKNGSGDMKPSHVSTIYNSSSITLERQKAGPAIQLEDVIIPQTLHDLPDAIEYHRLVVRFLLSHHGLHLVTGAVPTCLLSCKLLVRWSCSIKNWRIRRKIFIYTKLTCRRASQGFIEISALEIGRAFCL
jgi:hypothetical protein